MRTVDTLILVAVVAALSTACTAPAVQRVVPAPKSDVAEATPGEDSADDPLVDSTANASPIAARATSPDPIEPVWWSTFAGHVTWKGAYQRSIAKRLQAVGLRQFKMTYERAEQSPDNPWGGDRCIVRVLAGNDDIAAVREAFPEFTWDRE